MFFNARSIRNKMPELRCLVATETVDILAITETWLEVEGRDYEGEYALPGFTMYRKDRIGRLGGGVILYARNNLNTTPHDIEAPYELVSMELNGHGPKIRVIVVYRPPHMVVEEEAELYGLLTRQVQGVTVVLGDFNSCVDWGNRAPEGASGRRLLEFADGCFLSQFVEEPTRGDRTLDLIFATEVELIGDVSVGECLGNSDHNVVRCRLVLPTNREAGCVRRKLNFRRANFNRFKRGLRDLPLPIPGEVDTMWNAFKAEFMALQANCIPYRRVGGSSKVSPTWFNRQIGQAIAERKLAYGMVKTHPTPEGVRRLAILRRQVKRLVRTAKRNEELRVAEAAKRNPKEFFAYVNSRKPIRGKIGPLTSNEGNLIVGDEEIANELNTFFTSVFTVEDGGEPPQPTVRYLGDEPLQSIRCNEQDVAAKITKMGANKAAGPDGFYPKVIKAVAPEIVPHLAVLFNESLSQGVTPEDTRIANVTPIFKKGATDAPGNYRPISLTSVVGKLLESIIADRIVGHLEANNLLANSQHGFRRKRSCLTNLLEFFHHMLTVYDETRAIDVVYLDFRKAFDKVPHRRLMAKVRALGIVGTVAGWIESWLTDRKQRVVVNGYRSQWAPVISGVPQGSVLGPLLFLIYINDIDDGIVSKLSKFADDTKMGANAANPEAVRNLQQDLSRLGDWSATWSMPFNTAKCKVMHIGYNNQMANYTLNGHQIEATDAEKDLGVIISKDLKFTKQCVEVEKKAQKLLGYISRQFRYREKKVVLTLYNALVRPHLEYAVQFWAPTLVQDIERLERVQARATKMIPSLRFKGYQRRLNELKLYTLEERRLRGQLIETFKILKGLDDVDYRSLFTLSDNPTRNHGWKLELKRFRTRPCGDFMTYRICNVWNGLPPSVVQSETLDTFKRRLDRVLFTRH